MTSLIREQVMLKGANRPLGPAPIIDHGAIDRGIAAGTIIDRGPDFLAQGHWTRYAYV